MAVPVWPGLHHQLGLDCLCDSHLPHSFTVCLSEETGCHRAGVVKGFCSRVRVGLTQRLSGKELSSLSISVLDCIYIMGRSMLGPSPVPPMCPSLEPCPALCSWHALPAHRAGPWPLHHPMLLQPCLSVPGITPVVSGTAFAQSPGPGFPRLVQGEPGLGLVSSWLSLLSSGWGTHRTPVLLGHAGTLGSQGPYPRRDSSSSALLSPLPGWSTTSVLLRSHLQGKTLRSRPVRDTRIHRRAAPSRDEGSKQMSWRDRWELALDAWVW